MQAITALRNAAKCFNFTLNSIPKRFCYNDTNNKEYQPWERRKFRRRIGYTPHYHEKGLLPRLKEDSDSPLSTPTPLATLNFKKAPDIWHKREALFGQNDYIDILGDSDVKPYQVVKNVPWWLKGFRGHEMKIVQRRLRVFRHFQWKRPVKFNEMEKRVDYLYKYLNYKSRPPKYVKYQTKLV